MRALADQRRKQRVGLSEPIRPDRCLRRESLRSIFLGEVCLVVLCLSFVIRYSRTSDELTALAREVAVLRASIEEIERARGDHSPY
jgi:hypothetical protein